MTIRDLMHVLSAALTRQDGQTMAEYGVVLALITLAVVGALGVLALGISGKLGFVTNAIGSSL